MSEMRYFTLLVILAVAGLVLMVTSANPLVVLESPEVHHVNYVISGSEFVIDTGDRVKLIGIETPVWPAADSSLAQLRLIELILDKDVLLERDEQNKDVNGKLLRYAAVDGVFVNAKMVSFGLAKPSPMPPNLKYQDMINNAIK